MLHAKHDSYLTPLLPGGFTCKSHIFAPLYNSITCYLIVLERAVQIPQKTWQLF